MWSRLEELLEDEPAETEKKEASSSSASRKRGAGRKRKRRLRRIRTLDFLGVVAWSIILISIVVGDPLRLVLAAVAPSALGLLDIRWVLVVVVVALVLILFKARTLGIGIAYVALFPLIVLAWKIPRFFVRRRSTSLVIGVIGIASTVAARAKLFLVAFAAACISVVLIVSSNSSLMVVAGIIGLLISLLWWLIITAIDLLRSTAFVRAQERFLKWVTGLSLVETLITHDYPDAIELRNWTLDDAKKFRDGAGNALIAHRILALWARSLDNYRRGPAIIILNALTATALFIQVVVAFSFVHYGLYLISPIQFTFSSEPGWATFVSYSAAAVAFGEISALTPASDPAIWLKLLNGFVGSVGVATVIISGFVVYRTNRADVGSLSMIKNLRGKAREIEDAAMESHQMSLSELELQLAAVSWGLVGAIGWLARVAPAPWEEGSD